MTARDPALAPRSEPGVPPGWSRPRPRRAMTLGGRTGDECTAEGDERRPGRALEDQGRDADARGRRFESQRRGSRGARLRRRPVSASRRAGGGFAARAAAIQSDPCWTVMAGFAGRLPIDADVLRRDGDVAWAARNSSKPGRSGPGELGCPGVARLVTPPSRALLSGGHGRVPYPPQQAVSSSAQSILDDLRCEPSPRPHQKMPTRIIRPAALDTTNRRLRPHIP